VQRRWLFVGILTVALIVAAIIIFQIKKSAFPLNLKKGEAASVSSIISAATGYETKGNLIEAKATYQRLISEYPNSSDVVNWQKKVEGINIRLLFSPTITPKSTSYTIRPGDTLVKIARDFKTTTELIMLGNGIKDNKIIPGQRIKVWTAPFSIVVDKSQNTLILKSDEEVIKTYLVSTGENNSTPVGTFKIVNKLPHPTWFKAGAVVKPDSPENILGSRWLGLNVTGYGIHGTTDPASLGRQVTQGCIRMANADVEELYAIVPEGTEVIIFD